jgi:hypothetical protein
MYYSKKASLVSILKGIEKILLKNSNKIHFPYMEHGEGPNVVDEMERKSKESRA